MKKENIFFDITKEARIYIKLVWMIFVLSAMVCIGLLINGLWLFDVSNAYGSAVELADGLLRMAAAATGMTVFIDIYSVREV